MIEFTISIAGVAVGIRALFESSRVFCEGYLTDKPPEIIVESNQEIIKREQERSDRQAIEEGKISKQFKESTLERLGIYREIAEQFLDRDILLFHGSAIAVNGKGYLFAAKSGTGKSTHAKKWCQMLGERAVMVNDDKPMLKITPEGCFVCGTPWNGKHRIGNNIIIPLKAICLLERAKNSNIRALDLWDSFPILIEQCYHPMNRFRIPKAIELLYNVLECTKQFRMECNNLEADAAEISFNRMTEEVQGGIG